jgi:transcriptional regulator with XRE-family HTH domain
MLTFTEKFAQLVRDAEKERGTPLSNNSISKMTGRSLSTTYIHRLKTGDLTNPTKDKISALAEAFGVTPAWFFDESQYPLSTAQSLALAEKVQKLTDEHGVSFEELMDLLNALLVARARTE